MDYDRRYQDSKDGALKKDLRDRISRFRTLGFTLAEIAEAIGFSGPFVSQLLNEKSPARVRSIHIPKILKALEEAEREEEQKAVPGQKPIAPAVDAPMSLQDHMNAIYALGYSVTVSKGRGH